jgi:hypothetical protein
MDANLRAGADRRERRALREDLGVGPDAHFEVLGPHAARDQHLLEPHRVGRTGADGVKAAADHGQDRRPQAVGLAGISPRLLLDHALEQAGDERDAARLHGLQIAGGEQPGRTPVASVG